jgi:hypothetical protein
MVTQVTLQPRPGISAAIPILAAILTLVFDPVNDTFSCAAAPDAKVTKAG